MPGLMPGIHAATNTELGGRGAISELSWQRLGVDGRDKPGHDTLRRPKWVAKDKALSE
jgi:hypothetical protein